MATYKYGLIDKVGPDLYLVYLFHQSIDALIPMSGEEMSKLPFEQQEAIRTQVRDKAAQKFYMNDEGAGFLVLSGLQQVFEFKEKEMDEIIAAAIDKHSGRPLWSLYPERKVD